MLPFAIVFITGCVFSFVRWNENFSESKLLYLTGLFVSFAEAAWAVSTVPDAAGPFLKVLPIVASMFSWVFFYHGLMMFFFFAVAKEMMGDDRVSEHISFDKADAAMKKRNYKEAEELYIEAVQQFRTRAEPRIQLAEFYAKRGRHEDAAAQFQAVLGLVKDLEARARFTFRLAEMLQNAGKKEEARAALKSFQQSAANTRFAEFAALRLSEL
ncbi:MAG: hypothetical protein QF437_32275 [Planctomycetota bacterium]|jgi:tetratricopeptide (TPR) repeat protein|nr:hypothetical protein [Planctomycetota bacterium]MDP7135219.1 hypothetical protein [Planctomycetota bacterium]MDP7249346.1 hypothetical protein [Planctomycetota bacterium]